MNKPAFLEDFDDETALGANLVTASPSEDWLDGHAQGFQAGQIAAEANVAQAVSELTQTLHDMAYGYAEAKLDILRQLEPLFEALIDRFLPALADMSLVPQLQSALARMTDESLQKPLRLSVSPTQVVAVSDALAAHPGLPFVARSDPKLTDGQAIVSSQIEEVMIDLDSVLNETRQALAALFWEPKERQPHG